MSQQVQMRDVRPVDKLSTRLAEVQAGVRASEVIAGRGIRVTQTSRGTIVEADASIEDVSETASAESNIPKWG